jgi:hypothetical protein
MGLLKEVSNVHGAWHSPSVLHTMVRGINELIIVMNIAEALLANQLIIRMYKELI